MNRAILKFAGGTVMYGTHAIGDETDASLSRSATDRPAVPCAPLIPW